MTRALKAAIVVAGLAGLVLFGREAAAYLPAFARWVQSLGVWGPVAFVAGYALASVLMMPAFLLTIASGALWGFWSGLAATMTGAAVGSTCAFLAARYLVRRHVEEYVKRHPRLHAVDRAVESEGARLVFLLRLSPAIPYVLLNYVLGVSRLTLRDYTAGLLGMALPSAMYVYAGKLAGDLAVVAAGAGPPRGTAYYAMAGGGFAATVAATALVTRAARRALTTSMAAQSSTSHLPDER